MVDAPAGAVAGLVEPDPLVLQRVVHHDLLAEDLPAVFDDAQIRGVLLRLPAGVEVHPEFVAAHREPEVDVVGPPSRRNHPGRASLNDVHVPLEPEDVADDRADEDDDDGEMGDVDAEARDDPLLCIQVKRPAVFGHARPGEGAAHRGLVRFGQSRKSPLLLPPVDVRERSLDVLVQRGPRVPHDLDGPREPV